LLAFYHLNRSGCRALNDPTLVKRAVPFISLQLAQLSTQAPPMVTIGSYETPRLRKAELAPYTFNTGQSPGNQPWLTSQRYKDWLDSTSRSISTISLPPNTTHNPGRIIFPTVYYSTLRDGNKKKPSRSFKAKLEGGRLSQELIVFFWWGRHNPLDSREPPF